MRRLDRFVLALVCVSAGSHLLLHLFAAQLARAGHGARLLTARLAASRPPAVNPSYLAATLQLIPDHLTSVISAPARSSSSSVGIEAAAPAPDGGGRRLSVLIVHEHHLKAIGSDLRLLGILLQLSTLRHTTSLLFRGTVPHAQRSPPTEELLRLIGSTNQTDAQVLWSGTTPLPPPAIYEYTNLGGLAALARLGQFDAVLCSFWFWRDPAPSTAELMIPTLVAHAPLGRRPFVAALSDDAHSAKAAMMADWEPTADKKALWQLKARALPPRQRAVYALSDVVVHISSADAAIERQAFNTSCAHWRVLPMSPRAFTRGGSSPSVDGGEDRAVGSAGTTRPAGEPLRIGFVGNGVTPTNYLAIGWFLSEAWSALRTRIPTLRLRLVGFPPDDRPKRRQHGPCSASAETRCGWAWGTPFVRREAEEGIDELGFLSDEDMLAELLSWRAMVVPILRSTGVNTKLLPALRWGVPIVLTSVAAAPLGIRPGSGVALLADDAASFGSQLLQLLTDTAQALTYAAASRAHWTRLLEADAAATELKRLLDLGCRVARDTPEESRPLPPLLLPKGFSRIFEAEIGLARRHPTASRCFDGVPPALLVVMHGSSASERAVLLVHRLLHGLCQHCELRCFFGKRPRPRQNWDVLVEYELPLPLESLSQSVARAADVLVPRTLKLVHLPTRQLTAALTYSSNGASMASVVRSEAARARLSQALDSAGAPNGTLVSMVLEMRANATGRGMLPGWRALLQQLAVLPLEEERLALVADELRHQYSSAEAAAPLSRGCYHDSTERDLAEGPRMFGYSSTACAAACVNWTHFALQGGGQCFCGAGYGHEGHQRLPDKRCGRICEGEESKAPPRYCGGGWANAVYERR